MSVENNPAAANAAREVSYVDDELRAAFAGERFLIIEGAMGTILQQRGVKEADSNPELLCISQPELITGIHRDYVDAGADVSTTNTFGANARKLAGAATVEEVFAAAVACARAAGPRYVAAAIGPLGVLLEPFGDMSLDAAYELFEEEARAAEKAGADFFTIETMSDLRECLCAIDAVKSVSDKPIVAQMTFNEHGRTLMGSTATECAAELEARGAGVVGINCSLGPSQLQDVAADMLAACACPVVVEPNAGLPVVEDGKTVYKVSPEEFIVDYRKLMERGVGILGSCCGTSPAFTKLIYNAACEMGAPIKRG